MLRTNATATWRNGWKSSAGNSSSGGRSWTPTLLTSADGACRGFDAVYSRPRGVVGDVEGQHADGRTSVGGSGRGEAVEVASVEHHLGARIEARPGQRQSHARREHRQTNLA